MRIGQMLPGGDPGEKHSDSWHSGDPARIRMINHQQQRYISFSTGERREFGISMWWRICLFVASLNTTEIKTGVVQ